MKSDLVDIIVQKHAETSRAILVSDDDDAMLRAATKISQSDDYRADDTIGGAIWRAMIDAALSSKEAKS